MGSAQPRGAQAAISREGWGEQGTHSKGQEEGGSITHPHRLLPWPWGYQAEPGYQSQLPHPHPHPLKTAHVLWGPRWTTAGPGSDSKERGLDSQVPCIWDMAGNGQGGTLASCPVPGTQLAGSLGQGGSKLQGMRTCFLQSPPRPKALPGQPGAALGPISGYVGGHGVKLGCEKQWGLGQISGALEQQATGGTQGCTSG